MKKEKNVSFESHGLKKNVLYQKKNFNSKFTKDFTLQPLLAADIK